MTDTPDKSEDDQNCREDAESPAAPTETPGENGAGDTGSQEVGGPKGPEPTRYGDWEKNGIASDF